MNSLNLESITKKERKVRVAKSSAKEEILLVALEEFKKRGFNGASTTEIAEEVGVTQPLLHYHFSSKLSLFKACVDYFLDGLNPGFVTEMLPFLVRELMEDSERKDYIDYKLNYSSPVCKNTDAVKVHLQFSTINVLFGE